VYIAAFQDLGLWTACLPRKALNRFTLKDIRQPPLIALKMDDPLHAWIEETWRPHEIILAA
jgi:hypothetical protein